MKISYAIPVCNELAEIKRLLSFLIENKRDEDEIVIVYDSVNGTKEVREYLVSVDPGTSYRPLQDYPVRWYSYDFDGDFSKMKNKLTEMCTGDYVFQIDADEMVDEYVIRLLPQVLEHNNVDVIMVPRINTVEGLTPEHVSKWRWRLESPQLFMNTPVIEKEMYTDSDDYQLLKQYGLIISEE